MANTDIPAHVYQRKPPCMVQNKDMGAKYPPKGRVPRGLNDSDLQNLRNPTEIILQAHFSKCGFGRHISAQSTHNIVANGK